MAKKIRFPLKMKNGAEVRTLDELKENFDLESVLGYFTDGRLATWLADRYYVEKAEAVSALSADMPELNAKLCEILEVEYQAENDETDVEVIARRREKLRILSSVTDDKEILDNVDLVAMDQDELNNLYFFDTNHIYLYGEDFEIPFGRKNTQYIGLNEPFVILGRNKTVSDFENEGITFQKVRFEDDANPSGEKLFIAGKYYAAFPLVEKEANNGNPRAMYLMGLYYDFGYDAVTIDVDQRNYWLEKGHMCRESLASYWYAKRCLEDNSEEQSRIYQSIFGKIKDMADSGDSFAQQTLGTMYATGRGTVENHDMAIKYYKLSAEQGNAVAQCYLGNRLLMCGDNKEAEQWLIKSAEQGLAVGQYNLGVTYQKANDISSAVRWYKQAKAQGYQDAKEALENLGVHANISFYGY